MLASRPVIFISAVSRELRSTRDLVAKTLAALGYEPKWQDIAPTETGDLKSVLRKWVDSSHAVLQIVGHRYGFAPTEPDPVFGSVSYTQYEALYAHAQGKKVWYIILDGDHPVDCHDDEPEEFQRLQAEYRIQVRARYGLCHFSEGALMTENIVLKLRDDLHKLRKRARLWTAVILALLLLVAAGVIWNAVSQGKTGDKLAEVEEQNETLLQAMQRLPAAMAVAMQAAPDEHEAARTARAYRDLENSLGLPPGTLEKEMPVLAERLLAAPDTALLDRAKASFVLKRYAEAEKLALQAAAEAEQVVPADANRGIEALSLAGEAANEQLEHKRALGHYQMAAALSSIEKDVLEWAAIQNRVAWLLGLDGRYAEMERQARGVVKACSEAGHKEHPEMLWGRNILGVALCYQGRFEESEREHRAALEVLQKMMGAEHPDTLKSRINLSIALEAQGRYPEAETEYRTVLEIRERLFGAEHPVTIACRVGLANALHYQGDYAGAENEYRSVLAIQDRVLGPEHPDALDCRINLAMTLDAKGEHAEAERICRAVLAIRERVLGAEHPDSLDARHFLANSLNARGRHVDAEKEHRTVLAIRERVLGAEHPEALESRIGLANALYSQGDHPGAEREYTLALAIQERVLGPDHPDVFLTCYNLSLSLDGLGRIQEALRFARRALEGRSKVLGEDHPRTRAAREWVDSLESSRP